MRKMFLILVMGIGLVLGRAGAEAVAFGGQAVPDVSTFDEQSPIANSVAPAIAGQSAIAGDDAAAAAPVGVDRTRQFESGAGVHGFALLAIAALVAALGAAGATAVRVLEAREFFPGGLAAQPSS